VSEYLAVGAPDLLAAGWRIEQIVAEAARAEASQFRTKPYTADDFRRMSEGPGGYCALLFRAGAIQPGQGMGVAACRELLGTSGTRAHQLVTIAIIAGQTGARLGWILDELCEAFARTSGYTVRILRSRAPSTVYQTLGAREGGSPHGEATRFALGLGFQAMDETEALDFFGHDIARPHRLDLTLGAVSYAQLLVIESLPQEDEPPWFFIPMRKALTP
jgi:hypothetical protein